MNGDPIGSGGDWAMAANGTRVFWVSKLIGPLPPVAPPGMPTTGAGATPADLLAALGAALALLLAGGLLRRRVAGRA